MKNCMKTLAILAGASLTHSALFAENPAPDRPSLNREAEAFARPNKTDFSLAVKTFKIDYSVGKDGSLSCKMRNANGSGDLPVGGLVFPGRCARTADQNSNVPELVYVSHTITQESGNVQHATVVMRDAMNPLCVELHIRAFGDESVIEQWTVLSNNTKKTVLIPQLDSAFFQIDTSRDTWLESYDSSGGSEAGRPIRVKLSKGKHVLESSHGNRHVSGTQPFFALGFGAFPDESTVPCLVSSLAWTGSTRFSFEINNPNILEVSCGVNQPQPVPVNPGKTMASPPLVSTFSIAGKGPASRNFHRWVRRYGMRDGDRLRLVDNNSWEGCQMNVSESSIIEMMKLSAQLGIELYVMDDGWFGNEEHARVTDHAGLGDWQPNRQRFPNGLGPLIKAGKENNIAFGIWFEPEMVNPKSKLFEKHPEWVMRIPGRELSLERNQAVLDMANPEVQDFVYHAVADVLTANPGIRFVKWDANSSIRNPYSPYLGPERQGEMLNRYMAGYYGVMDKLVSAFPQVDFQACAGGGGRADLGALKFSHTFWPSDNTNPAYRLGAIWNFTLIMPSLAPTCHVTHAGGNGFRPKYRFDLSMMGQLGMEVDPRKSDPVYLASAKVGIAAYKGVREIVQFGDQYRHRNPFDSSTPSVNYVSTDRSRALVLSYQTADTKVPISVTSPVSGLAPARNYRVSEINLPPGDDKPRLDPAARKIQTGAEWMKQGIPLLFTRRCDSAAVTLEEVASADTPPEASAVSIDDSVAVAATENPAAQGIVTAPRTAGGPAGLAGAAQECDLPADSATLLGKGASQRNGMICDWDDIGTAAAWRVVLGAGEAEVLVRQAAETVSAGHEYSIEIAGNTLKGTVKDTGGWATFELVSLGKVTIDRAGEVKILLRPVKKGSRGLMNLQGIVLRGAAATNAKVISGPSPYPVCLAGQPLRGRTDIELMATHGSCIQTDIRHFSLLTAESWDILSWRSAGDYSGFEYAGGSGLYPDRRKAAQWPSYRTQLEILVDGKPQPITPGEITQQLDCRRTAGASQDLAFQRIDAVLATLQWATAWRCSNTSNREREVEFRLSLTDDASKPKSVESVTALHMIVKDDFVAHLLSFDRTPVVHRQGGEVKMVWKEKVAPGQSTSVSLGVRPAWSEAHENDRSLRNIGRYFTSAQWDARELQVCRQGEWRAAMDLLQLPGTDLNWDGLARIAGVKEKLLRDKLPRLAGFSSEWEGAWEYTYDLLRAGTKPANGLLTDFWLAADPSFYNWSFYWDTAGALHSYCHYRPEIAARTMRTYMRSAFLDDGSSVMMVHPVSTHMNTPQLLNIPMALWDCYLVSRDPAILAEAYPMLERHQDWLDNSFNRVKDGTVADIGFNIDYGSALHKERHVWVDMSMFQVQQYETLAKMAELLGRDAATVAKWRGKAAKLKEGINARMWNEEDGAYYALKSRNLEQTKVSCPIELNALIADVASPDQAKRLVARFMNPDKYAPGKRGRFFCPSVAFDDPSFRIVDGWGGPIWLIEPYYVVRGMARYGFRDEAAAIADNLYGMVAAEYLRTGSVWEQYRPDNGQCLNPGRRFFTSGITTSVLDMLLRGKFGFERCDEALTFRLTPSTNSTAWQGIDNLTLGGATRLDLSFRKQGASTACRVKFKGLPPGITRVIVTRIDAAGARKAVAELPIGTDGGIEASLDIRTGSSFLWQLR